MKTLRDMETFIAYLKWDLELSEKALETTHGITRELYEQRVRILKGEIAEKEAQLKQMEEEV